MPQIHLPSHLYPSNKFLESGRYLHHHSYISGGRIRVSLEGDKVTTLPCLSKAFVFFTVVNEKTRFRYNLSGQAPLLPTDVEGAVMENTGTNEFIDVYYTIDRVFTGIEDLYPGKISVELDLAPNDVWGGRKIAQLQVSLDISMVDPPATSCCSII